MTIKQIFKNTYIYRLYRYRNALFELQNWTDRDQKMLNFYSRFISPDDLVIDVGANIGNRTKIFLKIGARVIAVEPQTDCIKVLSKSFASNSNLTILNKALGNQDDQAEFFIADENTISSFSKDWIKAVKESGRFTENSWKSSRLVKMTTLDNIINKNGTPKFIKIDVEGFESSVLEGLSQPVQYLSIEFTPEFRENTNRCLTHLATLGKISGNFSIGESFTLVFNDWISRGDLDHYLDQFTNDNRIWGDIYIRFD